MARASQQTTGAITIWMIIFAALWLTSTVLLIILYTGQEELANENDRLTKANRQLVSQPERQSITLIRNLTDNGPTAVGILEDARRQTAALASGEEADDPATIQGKRDKLAEEIARDSLLGDDKAVRGQSLLDIASQLKGALQGDRAKLTEAEQAKQALQADVERLELQTAKQESDFKTLTEETNARIAEVEADRDRYRAERDGAAENMEREFETRRRQNDDALTQERLRTAKLERDLSELRQRFAAQNEKFAPLLIGPESLATARTADGTILTAVPGDEVVYIDLGRKDRLSLGLQFAVYSRDEGIPADGRSKAQIEVVSISESSAECRIVRVGRDEVIMTGDLVANPVYDAHRPQSFLVVGEFDLNRDGNPDAGGAAVIESLVKDWGGTLTAELSANTDFVVVGAAPKAPRAPSGREPSKAEAERMTAQQGAVDRYLDLVSTARSLSIPILTQDLFLNFLGYR